MVRKGQAIAAHSRLELTLDNRDLGPAARAMLTPARAMLTLAQGMKSVLLFSVLLNVALAAALVAWLSSVPINRTHVAAPINSIPVSSNLVRIVKTNVLVRPRAFTWQEVESPDYAVYVENLRALGMPETTIRDIIVADVDQIFAKRRRDDAARRDIEWWRATPSPEVQSNLVARAESLESERTALLTKLLGPDWAKGRAEQERTPLALTGPVLGNLPDEVKQAVQSLAVQSQQRVQDYLDQMRTAGRQPSEAELARIREETRQQLSAILNPQQLEEFLLRYSEDASRLRRELAGFNPTPDEFRSIFRATDPIDREIQSRFSGDDPASRRARQALEEQRTAAIRNIVGADRFAAYQQAQDPAFREAVAAAQEAGGGEETATALYEISRATRDEFNRIRNDPSLTDAQKQQQLQQAQLEQERARALVLGETPPPQTVTAPVQPEQPPFRPHALEPFETLGQLSVRYGLSYSELRAANPGVDINRAPAGTIINIPVRTAPAPLPYPPGAAPR